MTKIELEGEVIYLDKINGKWVVVNYDEDGNYKCANCNKIIIKGEE